MNKILQRYIANSPKLFTFYANWCLQFIKYFRLTGLTSIISQSTNMKRTMLHSARDKENNDAMSSVKQLQRIACEHWYYWNIILLLSSNHILIFIIILYVVQLSFLFSFIWSYMWMKLLDFHLKTYVAFGSSQSIQIVSNLKGAYWIIVFSMFFG